MIHKKKLAAFTSCAFIVGGLALGISIKSYSANVSVNINAESFPDKAFRSYVSEQFDTDKNGSLSTTEIKAATSIDVCRNSDIWESGITSLEGIQYLTSLEYLYCSYNNITSLDLDANSKLTWICVDHNQLSNLTLPHNAPIACLYCNDNKLTSLSLAGLSKLTSLDCSNNALTALDLSQNTKLEDCRISNNALTALDISANTKLDALDVHNNAISSLDISKNKALSGLSCYGNRFSKLSLTGITKLQAIVKEYRSEIEIDPLTGQPYYCYSAQVPDDELEGLMVDEGVTVSDPAPLPPTGLPFVDVYSNDWFLEAIFFVYNYDLMSGKSNTIFDPHAAITRSEVVTVLYNKDDHVPTDYDGRFTDVPNGEWYSLPISWAARGNIVAGYGDTFGTFDTITREQLATMLYNYSGYHQADTSYDDSILATFPDAGSVSDWANIPIKWAVSKGIISGKQLSSGEIILDPSGQASRAECAQMMKNYMEKFEGLNQ